MITEKIIPRGEQGIRAILYEMRRLSITGSLNFGIAPAVIDTCLRRSWIYEFSPLGPQVLQTVQRMWTDFGNTGFFHGACADAAVLAGAMLCGNRPYVLAAWFVAVRPPHEPDFEHVFTECLGPGLIRIDPTAPLDADYTHFQRMEVPFL